MNIALFTPRMRERAREIKKKHVNEREGVCVLMKRRIN